MFKNKEKCLSTHPIENMIPGLELIFYKYFSKQALIED